MESKHTQENLKNGILIVDKNEIGPRTLEKEFQELFNNTFEKIISDSHHWGYITYKSKGLVSLGDMMAYVTVDFYGTRIHEVHITSSEIEKLSAGEGFKKYSIHEGWLEKHLGQLEYKRRTAKYSLGNTMLITVPEFYDYIKIRYNSKLNEQEMNEILKEAEDGDAESLYELGMLEYRDGYEEIPRGPFEPIKEKHQKAFEYFLKSAEAGDKRAQYMTGYIYYLGSGVEKDLEKSLEWLKKSDIEEAKAMVKEIELFPDER